MTRAEQLAQLDRARAARWGTKTPEERFWAKVEKTGACWLWTASLVKNGGYGQFNLIVSGRKTPVRAHRYSYELAFGPIPDGLHVCHRCDVPRCVRPEHLFLGTDTENMRDCIAKGRFVPPPVYLGVEHHAAKLTPERVRVIRARFADGQSVTGLARAFSVNTGTISDVVRNRTWRHVS